ncbi:Ig-like domain-containing protein [Nocardioides lijunqiniae]|uniref:Ig-like domain-containing protein n=1 Tax=Nocardioides lijunqiniae TaxID=2760832 RepID=UPI0018780F87
MVRACVVVVALLASALALPPASAQVPRSQTFTLSGATFSDGGTATGSFVLRAASESDSASTIERFDVTVSGGSFDATNYSSTAGDAGYWTLSRGELQVSLYKAGSSRTLRFAGAGLDGTSGTRTVPLSVASASGNVECYNCSPYRRFTAGELQAAPTALVAQSLAFTSTPPTAPGLGSTYSPTATGTGPSGPVTFSVGAASTPGTCTISSDVVTFSQAGTCVVAADRAGDADFAAAPTITQSIVVPDTQTIAFPTLPSPVRGGDEHALTATSSSGLPVSYSVASGTTNDACRISDDGTAVVFRDSGTCAVAADQPGSATVRPAPRVVRSTTVDASRPSVALTAPPGPLSGTFPVTVTFSEAVAGLSASDFVVTNGIATDVAGSGDTYTVDLSALTFGDVTIGLPAASTNDVAGNPNTAADPLTRTVVRPTFTTGPDATISGTPVAGGTLTAAPTDLAATTPAAASFAYAWAADGEPVPGARGATLTLTGAEVGTSITVTVTAKRDDYVDAADTSDPTAPVLEASFGTGPTATVTGTAQVGQTLSAGTGAPVPDPESYRFAWYADGTPVAGATSATLLLTPAHRGRRITVAVTAVRAGYADATSTSAPTAVVATDRAPALQLRLTVPTGSRDAATTPDGEPTVRRGASITLRWTSSDAQRLTATGELADLLRARYGDRPLPATGALRVRMDRAGAHRYRLRATNETGNTTATAGVVAVRRPTRLTVEAPATARPGRTIRVRVTGLGYRERFYVTLSDGRTTTRVRTGRADTHGNLVRRITLPRTLDRATRVTVRVTGRSTRRTGATVVRLP